MMRKRRIEIIGKKVCLRPFQRGDITQEYITWLNDPEVVKYSNQRFQIHTEETCNTYWESFRHSQNLFMNIKLKENELSVGTMTAYISTPHQTADIGILIGNKAVWGHGIGTDAWNTLADWLMENGNIRKITAGAISENIGMIKIMESYKMIWEATRSNQEIFNGKPCDVRYYAKFNQKLKK
jgi:ribosomal-protein-alanine N-acetyltransferase